MNSPKLDPRNLPPAETSAAQARDISVPQRAPAGSRRTVDFGVVVGIEHYPYFRSLHGAANDARAFRDWLQDKRGGGLDPDNVRLVLSDPERETPAQDEIDREFVAVLKAAQVLGGARRLYFYFSGHGAMNPDRMRNDVLLLLTRWSECLVRLALSTDLYSSTLCSAGLFEEVVIFIDCCRSISASVVGLEPLFVSGWGPPACATQKFLAYATEARNPAFECPDSGQWHGIFTQCLLSILRESSAEGIYADQLRDRLKDEVERKARRHHVFQRAHVDSSFSSHMSFGSSPRRSVLERLPGAARMARIWQRSWLRSWSLLGSDPVLELRFVRRQGEVFLRRGDLQVVAVHVAGDKPWRLRLPIGLYQIEGEGGRDAVRFEHDGWKVFHDV